MIGRDTLIGRRNLTKALLLGAVALPLCSATPLLAQEQKTLRVFASGTGDGMQQAFDAFEAKTGVKVEFEGVPFPDYQNTIMQRFRTGNSGIDVFLVDPTYIPIFADRGFLRDLTDDFAAKAEGVLFPGDVIGATYEGRMLTMPMWESTQVLFYNRDLLEAAGIEPPAASTEGRWTWDQLLEAAQKAKAAGAAWGFGFEQVDRYYQLQILPESLGGGPGVTGDKLLTVDVANDAWIKAGDWYGKLYADGIAPPAATNGAEMQELFRNGQLAFFVAGPWVIGGLNAAEGLNYGVGAHPYFAGGVPATPSESWHLGIAASAGEPELALQFLEFIGLDTDGAKAAAASHLLSANVAAASELLASLPAANPAITGIDQLISTELATTAVRRPRTLGYLQLEELVSRAWGDIRNGASAAETFKRIQSELEPTFRRIGR